MPTQENQFHDPALKDAVRRCWAGDCPSEQLRKRVLSLLADQPLAENPARRGAARQLFFRPWVIGPMAAAAVVAISFILLWKILLGPRELPNELAVQLIHTHDNCCAMPSHQELKDKNGALLAKSDDTGMKAALREHLAGRPVVIYHPEQVGWNFHGAACCMVGATLSGHLVYSRGNEDVSVFMLPGNLIHDAKEGAEYAATVDKHCVVGFIKNGALFCLVGSGSSSVSIDQLKQMQSQMEPAIAMGPQVNRVVLAELLRPVH